MGVCRARGMLLAACGVLLLSSVPVRAQPEGDLQKRYQDLSGKYDELKQQVEALQPVTPLRPPEEEPRFRVKLEEGFVVEGPDRTFTFNIRNLTQVEYTGVSPASSLSPGGFAIPRQRLYFYGDVLEHFNYYTMFQASYGAFTLLDTWIGVDFDPRFRLRVGHFRSPFLYEFFTLPEDKLISVERSVINNTVIPERQTGVMIFGDLLDGRLNYNVGVFNGPNHVFPDGNVPKDFIGMLDVQPFLCTVDGNPLKYLHLVGSLDFGTQDQQVTSPQYRLNSEMNSVVNSEATLVSPSFLTFREKAVARGGRLLMAGELVWFYDGVTVLAGIHGGHQRFAIGNGPTVKAPVHGYTAAATYFLTGEKPTRRDDIRPLRNFDPRAPLSNSGAVELFARIAHLNVGRELVDQAIVVRDLSTTDVDILDLGAIWYLNQYTAFWFAYQHSWLGNPIRIPTDRATSHYDLFTVRMQFFF